MKFDESCPVSSPVAPCSSLIGFHIRWDSSGNAINPWRAREKTATELDHCQMGVSCGLAAAHSLCRHSGGAQRDGRHQSEPDRREAPGILYPGVHFIVPLLERRMTSVTRC